MVFKEEKTSLHCILWRFFCRMHWGGLLMKLRTIHVSKCKVSMVKLEVFQPSPESVQVQFSLKFSWLIHFAASEVETRMKKKSDKIPLRVSIRKTLTDFAENTTIHGIGYIFNTFLPFIERCLWTVAFGFFACLAIYLSAKAAVEWQSDPVITTVKSTGRNKL